MIFEHIKQQASDLAIFAGVALTFGVIKALVSPEKQTFKGLLLSLVVSVSVGVLVGGFAMDCGLSAYGSLICTSIASLVSRDIILAILNNKDKISELVGQGMTNIVDRITRKYD